MIFGCWIFWANLQKANFVLQFFLKTFFQSFILSKGRNNINMKLLQVVSLQNSFYNSNDDENSDLVKFNISKFVHISSLTIFDFRVFYMS
jgi:hypothetical protein